MPEGKRSLAAPIFVIGLMLGALILWATAQFTTDNNSGLSIPSGQRLVENFGCAEGEIKYARFGGREDGFAQGDIEVGTPLENLQGADNSADSMLDRPPVYDAVVKDFNFTDRFEIPADIASGLIVIGLRDDFGGSQSDTIFIGSRRSIQRRGIDELYPGGIAEASQIAVRHAEQTLTRDDFLVDDNLLAARFKELRRRLKDGGLSELTVLDLVQSSHDDMFELWVKVADDTPVDFIAIAVCERPVRRGGYAIYSDHDRNEIYSVPEEFTYLGCPSNGECYLNDVGHLSCKTPAPVACFLDQNLPYPAEKFAAGSDLAKLDTSRNWLGGEVRYSAPVPGERFATIREADKFCASEFGSRWRTLRFYDAGANGILAIADRLERSQPIWIHYPGSQYANCWASE